MSEETAPAVEVEKKAKKLIKDLTEAGKVKITVSGFGMLTFDTADLSTDIQTKLVPFGLGHKLGDAAAGRDGQDAVDAISKVWDGLKNGDWSVRAPAQPKVTLSSIKDNLALLSDAERKAAEALLAQMGIKL
jgi:hypothetical protein